MESLYSYDTVPDPLICRFDVPETKFSVVVTVYVMMPVSDMTSDDGCPPTVGTDGVVCTVGVSVGVSVTGGEVGLVVGADDGFAVVVRTVGLSVGVVVGSDVGGMVVCPAIGADVGFAVVVRTVGLSVGVVVGSDVGGTVGAPAIGADDGFAVGVVWLPLLGELVVTGLVVVGEVVGDPATPELEDDDLKELLFRSFPPV